MSVALHDSYSLTAQKFDSQEYPFTGVCLTSHVGLVMTIMILRNVLPIMKSLKMGTTI